MACYLTRCSAFFYFTVSPKQAAEEAVSGADGSTSKMHATGESHDHILYEYDPHLMT